MKVTEHCKNGSTADSARSANVNGNPCQATSVGTAKRYGVITMPSKTSSRQLSKLKSIKQGH